MSLSQRIKQLQNKKSKSDHVDSIVKLMKYFSWTLEEIKRLSIPSYLIIIEQVNTIEKKNSSRKNKK